MKGKVLIFLKIKVVKLVTWIVLVHQSLNPLISLKNMRLVILEKAKKKKKNESIHTVQV